MNICFQSISEPQPYERLYQKMRNFTHDRNESTQDEIWFLEHTPVFTQGQAGKPEHILQATNIPIVQTDRGGQVTYHGPGQLMIYCLIDLKRRHLGIRDYVTALENTVIDLLESYQLKAHAKRGAPGVYLEDGAKIASIGLRVRKGRSYHGICLNLAGDLSPFQAINPCGFQNLKVTKLQDHVKNINRFEVEQTLRTLLNQRLKAGIMPCREYEG